MGENAIRGLIQYTLDIAIDMGISRVFHDEKEEAIEKVLTIILGKDQTKKEKEEDFLALDRLFFDTEKRRKWGSRRRFYSCEEDDSVGDKSHSFCTKEGQKLALKRAPKPKENESFEFRCSHCGCFIYSYEEDGFVGDKDLPFCTEECQKLALRRAQKFENPTHVCTTCCGTFTCKKESEKECPCLSSQFPGIPYVSYFCCPLHLQTYLDFRQFSNVKWLRITSTRHLSDFIGKIVAFQIEPYLHEPIKVSKGEYSVPECGGVRFCYVYSNAEKEIFLEKILKFRSQIEPPERVLDIMKNNRFLWFRAATEIEITAIRQSIIGKKAFFYSHDKALEFLGLDSIGEEIF